MLKKSFKFFFINYWRNIDKKILFSFLTLFFLGLFFSFSSTSSLAGERLDKDYYFFFTKHLLFTFLALSLMFLILYFTLNIKFFGILFGVFIFFCFIGCFISAFYSEQNSEKKIVPIQNYNYDYDKIIKPLQITIV